MAQATAKGVVHSVSSKRGTQREYESVTILRPSTGKPEIAALIERMQGTFNDYGARLIKIDSWGTRILAFPVDHERKGIYLYWRFLGGSDIVHEFERNLKLSDNVLRYYTVRIDEDIDPAARPSEITEDLLQTIAEPPPEPEPIPEPKFEEEDRFVNNDDDDDDRGS